MVVFRRIAVCLVLLVTAAPITLHAQASRESELVAQRAIEQLRSPYCPGAMLEICPSDQARLLRDSIYDLAAAGWTTEQLVEWMLANHGEEWRALPRRSGAGLWAWLAPQPRADEAVSQALAVARRNARAGVRHAASMIWATVAGMLFIAAMALARGFLTTEANLGGFIAIGAVQLMLAAWLALAFRYYQTRSAALARLEAIADALEE